MTVCYNSTPKWGKNMKNEYKISDILIGTLVTNQLIGGTMGFTKMEIGPLFFCKQESKPGKKQQYMELFDETIKGIYKLSKDADTQKFNKTYVIETDNIKNYLTEEELLNNTVTGKRLIEIYKNYAMIKREAKANIIPITETKEEKDKQLIKMPQLAYEKQA